MAQVPEIIFTIFVDDARYGVPTLKFISALDEARAWEQALKLLHESRDHLGVELRIGDRRLGGLGTYSNALSGSIGSGGPRRPRWYRNVA
jgi:hypothetical protein